MISPLDGRPSPMRIVGSVMGVAACLLATVVLLYLLTSVQLGLWTPGYEKGQQPTLVGRTGTDDGKRTTVVGVTVTVTDIDAASRALRGILTVDVPPDLAIRSGCPGDPVDLSPSSVTARGTADAVIVAVEGFSTQIERDEVVLPLGSFVDAGVRETARTQLELTMTQEGSFPRDTYRAAPRFDVRLSEGLWVAESETAVCPAGFLPASDAPFTVAVTGQVSGFDTSATGISHLDIIFPEATIELTRTTVDRWFVYAMLLIPLALLFGVIGTFLLGSGSGNRSNVVGLELAAGVLSLIALRSALVPADVGGLTVVDWVLGIELAAFVLCGIVLALFATTRQPAASSSSAADQTDGAGEGPGQ